MWWICRKLMLLLNYMWKEHFSNCCILTDIINLKRLHFSWQINVLTAVPQLWFSLAKISLVFYSCKKKRILSTFNECFWYAKILIYQYINVVIFVHAMKYNNHFNYLAKAERSCLFSFYHFLPLRFALVKRVSVR